jgi:hypothetical protein
MTSTMVKWLGLLPVRAYNGEKPDICLVRWVEGRSKDNPEAHNSVN